MAKLHRVYYFGKRTIVETFIDDCDEVLPLSLFSLLTIRSTDVIITPRAWSILFEFLFVISRRRRPFLVQLADGLIFPQNCEKSTNQRYGHLYKNVFADLLIIRQNREDLDGITEDLIRVQTISEVSSWIETVIVERPSAILVAGNDAIFDIDRLVVVEAFRACFHKLKKLGIERISLSCPDARLASDICKGLPGLKPIGRLSEHVYEPAQTVCVGSPSTVLFDNQLKGGVSCLLSIYSPAVLDTYLSTEAVFDAVYFEKGKTHLRMKRAGLRQGQTKVMTADLKKRVGSKQDCRVPAFQLLGNFRFSLLVRELQLLLRSR